MLFLSNKRIGLLMFSNILKQLAAIKNTMAATSDENTVNNEANEKSDKSEGSIEGNWESKLNSRLSDFDSASYNDFMIELKNELIKFGLEVDLTNKNVAISNDKEHLESIIGLFTDEDSTNESAEMDTRGVDDFLEAYLKEKLFSIHEPFDEIYSQISDGCGYVVTSNDWTKSKAKKKEKGASKSYAHYPHDEYPCDVITDLLVLFDTTLFGSADDGMVITGDFIAFKPMFEDKEFISISDIRSVRLDSSDKELRINNLTYNYIHSELDRPMKLVYKALKKYLDQPSLVLMKYLEQNPNLEK
jgi:hypothetical protein